MTVKELKELCELAIKAGYENKEVYISDDEEGNGYHELIYGFSNDPDILEDVAIDYDNIIVLG